jgi:hypothetical protein
MARLPIHIAVSPSTTERPDRLYIIADDGTMWSKCGMEPWYRIRHLPQDESMDTDKYLPPGVTE